MRCKRPSAKSAAWNSTARLKSAVEPLERRTMFATFTVTTTADAGDGSLRAAIDQTNAAPGSDTIAFAIDTGAQSITLLSELPAVQDPLTIDGSTQPGFTNTPLIELNGASAGAAATGLRIAAGGSTVRSLVINRFKADGLVLYNLGGNTIAGCYIGVAQSGATASPNGVGIVIGAGSTANTVGGLTVADRNVISGNTDDGIRITIATSGNIVRGNYIGVARNGTTALGNGNDGVECSGGATGNIIGGTAVEARNIISGNKQTGVFLDGAGTRDNLVQGNYIGANAGGTAALGNGFDGVQITRGAGHNTVGGLDAGAGNLISGNVGNGVLLQGTGAGSLVAGNRIGVNAIGAARLANGGQGIFLIGGTSGNTIGGVTPEARNVISGNSLAGIYIQNDAGGRNVVQGNYIGTNVAGTQAVPNLLTGVEVSTSDNQIGGAAPGAGNLTSGNIFHGLFFDVAAARNVAAGNRVGTNAAGTAAIPNGSSGIGVGFGNTATSCADNVIGGVEPGAGNLIAGNSQQGILVASGAVRTIIRGNVVGLDVSGAKAIPNQLGGVEVVAGSATTTLGGGTTSARNVISGNGSFGVMVQASGNTVRGNYIGANVAGDAALGNKGAGVSVGGESNLVGGPGGNDGNLIVGNAGDGVFIASTGAKNTIQRNLIGVNSAGAAMGNGGRGVRIQDGNRNAVGGTAGGVGNTIAFNGKAGVAVFRDSDTTDAGRLNPILGNGIYANGGLGIFLGNDGPTFNDPGDADNGGNGFQNYPVVLARNTGDATEVSYTLDSKGSGTYRIEFFASDAVDPTGFHEGQRFLGFVSVQTDAQGHAEGTATLPAVPVGQFISSTATEALNNTSEFSVATTVQPAPQPPTAAITSIAPNPRNQPFDQATITFSGAVSGFDLADLSLTRDGGPNLLVAGGPQTLVTADNATFVLGGLASLTTESGTYRLTLRAEGSGIANSAGLPLAADVQLDVVVDDTAPAVAGVLVSSSAWTPPYLTYLRDHGLGDGGIAVPLAGAGSTPIASQSNIDRILVRFSEPVSAAQASLALHGAAVANYVVSGFSYDSTTNTAAWSLAAPVAADRLRLDLGGVIDAAGNALDQQAAITPILILPGDVNRSGGAVSASDLVLTRNRIGHSVGAPGTGASAYDPFNDVNGDGIINAADLVLVRNRIGTGLPPAPAPTFGWRMMAPRWKREEDPGLPPR